MGNNVGLSRPQSDVSKSAGQQCFLKFDETLPAPPKAKLVCSETFATIEKKLVDFAEFVEQITPSNTFVQLGFVKCGKIKEVSFEFSRNNEKFERQEYRGNITQIARRIIGLKHYENKT